MLTLSMSAFRGKADIPNSLANDRRHARRSAQKHHEPLKPSARRLMTHTEVSYADTSRWKIFTSANTLVFTPNTVTTHAVGYLNLGRDGALVMELPPRLHRGVVCHFKVLSERVRGGAPSRTPRPGSGCCAMEPGFLSSSIVAAVPSAASASCIRCRSWHQDCSTSTSRRLTPELRPEWS